MVICSCQLELRIAAHFSADSRLIAVLNEGTHDVFHLLHAEWHTVPVETVTTKQRAVAKRVCYGILYGMGSSTLAQELGCTKHEAAEHISSFMSRCGSSLQNYLLAAARRFSGIKSFIQQTAAACRESGC